MARVPSKHSRDQNQDFEGLLNNLQDWELSFKDKDKKLKSQFHTKEKLDGTGQQHGSGKAGKKYDYLRNYDTLNQLSRSLMKEESPVDANSEKELGNEYFKQKKYNDAIDCYSRSIALLPTAVAYANRAMAYIKINRFQEAEYDCSEALSLDDRYIKAYSRRITARKELGKLKEALEDADFALRLEPSNQEVKKQQTEVKSLLEKAILQRASVMSQRSAQGMQKLDKLKEEVTRSKGGTNPISSNFVRDGNREFVSDLTSRSDSSNVTEKSDEVRISHGYSPQRHGLETAKRRNKNGKQDLDPSVQELAARAATLAKAEAAKNVSPPTTAYQFEISWRGFGGDRNLQAHLLKATTPASLPHLFKNALTAPMLIDIVRCVATFFVEDMDLAVKYLENLTKIPRFDMIMMCLSSSDKADLLRIWSELMSKTTPEYGGILSKLQPKYRIQQQ